MQPQGDNDAHVENCWSRTYILPSEKSFNLPFPFLSVFSALHSHLFPLVLSFTESCYLAQAGLEFSTLLLPCSECGDYRSSLHMCQCGILPLPVITAVYRVTVSLFAPGRFLVTSLAPSPVHPSSHTSHTLRVTPVSLCVSVPVPWVLGSSGPFSQ